MSAYPLVSVIIPTYNRAGVICKTIDNVFSQTYKNIELIVIDDGSTDDTPRILRNYRKRIRLITQTNGGPAAARNRGIEASQGDIIAFQDSDDLWGPTKIQRQVALLSRFDDSVPCCLCNASLQGATRNPRTSFENACIYPAQDEGLWLNVAEVLASRFVLFNQAVAIRRTVLDKVGYFDEGLKYLEDYDLPLRLAMEGPWAFIREPLVIYRQGTGNSFSEKASRDPIVLKECEVVIFERALSRTKSGRDARLQKHLRSRLKTFRRHLLCARLSHSNPITGRIAQASLKSLDRIHWKLIRRTPWFVKAKTVLPNAFRASGAKPDQPLLRGEAL